MQWKLVCHSKKLLFYLQSSSFIFHLCKLNVRLWNNDFFSYRNFVSTVCGFKPISKTKHTFVEDVLFNVQESSFSAESEPSVSVIWDVTPLDLKAIVTLRWDNLVRIALLMITFHRLLFWAALIASLLLFVYFGSS